MGAPRPPNGCSDAHHRNAIHTLARGTSRHAPRLASLPTHHSRPSHAVLCHRNICDRAARSRGLRKDYAIIVPIAAGGSVHPRHQTSIEANRARARASVGGGRNACPTERKRPCSMDKTATASMEIMEIMEIMPSQPKHRHPMPDSACAVERTRGWSPARCGRAALAAPSKSAHLRAASHLPARRWEAGMPVAQMARGPSSTARGEGASAASRRGMPSVRRRIRPRQWR